MKHTVTDANHITLKLSLSEFTAIATMCDMVLTKSEKAGIKKPPVVEDVSKGVTLAALDMVIAQV